MVYYCDCSKGAKKADWGHGQMALTEADKEGICKKCGHYAMAFKKEVESKSKSGLYYALFNSAGATLKGGRKFKAVKENNGYVEDFYEEHRLLF